MKCTIPRQSYGIMEGFRIKIQIKNQYQTHLFPFFETFEPPFLCRSFLWNRLHRYTFWFHFFLVSNSERSRLTQDECKWQRESSQIFFSYKIGWNCTTFSRRDRRVTELVLSCQPARCCAALPPTRQVQMRVPRQRGRQFSANLNLFSFEFGRAWVKEVLFLDLSSFFSRFF